ncbi:MAG TPA: RNase adapter RapZ, partial [Alphaproteobacteria bacterium]|nr:RNase adapter RapZ [Alphaproteobacteria bacterium]
MSKASPRKNAATAIPLPPRRPVLLVTGLSGAGHSSALKTLEDMGYKAVDNLPLSLLEPLLTAGAGGDMPVAVGIDSR